MARDVSDLVDIWNGRWVMLAKGRKAYARAAFPVAGLGKSTHGGIEDKLNDVAVSCENSRRAKGEQAVCADSDTMDGSVCRSQGRGGSTQGEKETPHACRCQWPEATSEVCLRRFRDCLKLQRRRRQGPCCSCSCSGLGSPPDPWWKVTLIGGVGVSPVSC